MTTAIGEIRGLPAHVLLVHVVVILIPVAAASAVAAACWPRARRWLGPVPPVLALLALIAVPVTTQAGHWLRDRVAETPLIARHENLGEQLLPWVIALFVATAAAWLVGRRTDWDRQLPLRIGIAVVVTVIAVGATVQTVRIGESGSKAVWEGNVADQADQSR